MTAWIERRAASEPRRWQTERAARHVSRCGICGFTEVRTDEVDDRGTLLLSECPRCDHRWTAAAAHREGRSAVLARVRPSKTSWIGAA